MSSAWNLPVLRLIATDRCRVAAPWFSWSRGDDAVAQLRRRANAIERTRLGATHPVEQAAAALLYLPMTLPSLLRALLQWGRELNTVHGVSYARQCLHLGICAWHLGIRPQVYYYLRLHRLPWPTDWRQVIDPSELHHLQREISPSDLAPLDHKLRFTATASARNLPAIPCLAVWTDGRCTTGDADLRQDLFVKRAQSYGSIGVMAFRYNPITGAHHDDRRRYSEIELEESLRLASRGHTLLVQPRLRNHPDLNGFSETALCNYRIVTARQPGGVTEVLLAALRFPLNSNLTCAESDTTLCAAVNLQTGRLHPAESKHPSLGRLVRHPLSGQPIEGFVVPRWKELVALALAAHDVWPDYPFIGWDIADTTTGLFLLEGGCLWGGYLAQMSGSPPLGQTAFGRIYAAHLALRPPPVGP